VDTQRYQLAVISTMQVNKFIMAFQWSMGSSVNSRQAKCAFSASIRRKCLCVSAADI
jgi:hypothetical protein